jgi:hypothetical protein
MVTMDPLGPTVEKQSVAHFVLYKALDDGRTTETCSVYSVLVLQKV